MAYPDIDKIDTNIRHARGIIELIMDNIGNKVDSDQDAVEYALWSAAKHLREATNEIEDAGERNLSELLSRVDSDPLEDDEEADEEAEEDSDIPQPTTERIEIFLRRDGKITAIKEHYE